MLNMDLAWSEVVNALVKLEILKAIHNELGEFLRDTFVVNALVKLEILKAIHNTARSKTTGGWLSMH